MLNRIVSEYLKRPAANAVESVNPCSSGLVRCTILRHIAQKGFAGTTAAQGG